MSEAGRCPRNSHFIPLFRVAWIVGSANGSGTRAIRSPILLLIGPGIPVRGPPMRSFRKRTPARRRDRARDLDGLLFGYSSSLFRKPARLHPPWRRSSPTVSSSDAALDRTNRMQRRCAAWLREPATSDEVAVPDRHRHQPGPAGRRRRQPCDQAAGPYASAAVPGRPGTQSPRSDALLRPLERSICDRLRAGRGLASNHTTSPRATRLTCPPDSTSRSASAAVPIETYLGSRPPPV